MDKNKVIFMAKVSLSKQEDEVATLKLPTFCFITISEFFLTKTEWSQITRWGDLRGHCLSWGQGRSVQNKEKNKLWGFIVHIYVCLIH